jgi:hypothetical protein
MKINPTEGGHVCLIEERIEETISESSIDDPLEAEAICR